MSVWSAIAWNKKWPLKWLENEDELEEGEGRSMTGNRYACQIIRGQLEGQIRELQKEGKAPSRSWRMEHPPTPCMPLKKLDMQ